MKLGNTAGKLGWLVDTRGRGGYVVAPPTRLLQRRYSLVDGYPDPVPLPDWITRTPDRNPYHHSQPSGGPQTADRRPVGGQRSSAQPTGYVAAALAGEIAHVRAAQPGQRNHTLFCASVALGQLVGAGLVDETTVRDLLLAACIDHVGVDGVHRRPKPTPPSPPA